MISEGVIVTQVVILLITGVFPIGTIIFFGFPRILIPPWRRAEMNAERQDERERRQFRPK